ncbi:hypothetical protein CRU87_08565 [Aliarcobacter trophiarum LMG 25534]|uniref:Cytochrome b561 n=1 Tax=Aliarcobacter trophiarum LMG 25534 TaxID=1032241 RepID=A0AAD0QKJ3_9BACT|nr:cytochrome b/b6 domain-containing protein [Aliarcobacter trophiarum]AXK49161.1 cytochrome b561 [Aliarcobacter trophiarum LMG 25534]RXI26415.1 hypothetical protein CRU89_07055 [Aliarcobacter trophiarum]RXJ89860.1 hypothetical protein CRU87_08565 [Aliarcobacter trophiarum LMG 25534]
MGVFNEKRSLNLRVWHWLNSIAIIGLIFTCIFRSTWFNKNDNALIIQNKLSEFGLSLTNENAVVIAKLLRSEMWNWHYIFGFILVFLIIFRLFAFLSRSETGILTKIKESKNIHQKGAKIMHLLFYIVTFLVCLTGVLLYFRDDLNLAKSFVGFMKDMHKQSFFFYLFFIATHLFGVIVAETTTDKGLISEMFNGGK